MLFNAWWWANVGPEPEPGPGGRDRPNVERKVVDATKMDLAAVNAALFR